MEIYVKQIYLLIRIIKMEPLFYHNSEIIICKCIDTIYEWIKFWYDMKIWDL